MAKHNPNEMIWNSKSQRWLKKYEGKSYSVYATALEKQYPQLVTSLTKEGSRKAMIQWWREKRNEVSRHPNQDEIQAAITLRTKMARWCQLEDHEELRLQILDEADRLKRGMNDRTPLTSTTETIVQHVGREETFTARHLGELQLDPFAIPLSEYYGEKSKVWQQRIEQAEKHDAWMNSQTNDDDLYQLLEMFLDYKKGSNGHRRNLEREVKRFIKWLEKNQGSSKADTITSMALVQFKKYLEDDCGLKTTTSQPSLKLVKSFVRWLAEIEVIEIPKALLLRSKSLTIEMEQIHPRTWTDQQVKMIHDAPDRVKLFCLLSLNLGWYSVDIAHLRQEDVDWQKGAVKSFRHKTGQQSAFWFPLWGETFRLLKQFRSEGELVLTSENGTPLWCDESGHNKDIPGNQFRYWSKSIPVLNGARLKDLRKTGRNKLEDNDEYGRYAFTYRQASTKGTDKYYKTPPTQERFSKAIEWLGKQWGF